MQAEKILNHFVGRLARRRGRRAGLTPLSLALAALLVFSSSTASAQATAPASVVEITIVGLIKAITLDTPGDVFSSGTISIGTAPFAVTGDYTVIIPRNVLIDLPNGTVMTLQQFVTTAKVSGLPIEGNGLATILANKMADGQAIAGSVGIVKGVETLVGQVTFINHTDGYLRINGNPNTDIGGTILRINDPAGVYTVQQGLGCSALGGPNCSADNRFGARPESYTVAFASGMPACIPSTVTTATRPTGSSPTGVGDPFCPATNRSATSNVVADSTRFAPIQVGDNLMAFGNYETVSLVTFMSAWSVQVFAKLITQNTPTQPDYMQINVARWDPPGFPQNRVRAKFVGAGTDPAPISAPRLDIFAVHRGQDNVVHEFPVFSTVNNPRAPADFPPGAQFFQEQYDVDMALGAGLNKSPCVALIAAGFGSFCPTGATAEEDIRVLSPVAREVIGRTRHQKELNPGIVARNIQGAVTPTGQFVAAVGFDFPGFIEIDTGLLTVPFIFEGLPWNVDRRVGVGGCNGPCGAVQVPVSPFPISSLDPRTQVSPVTGRIALPLAVRNQPIAFFPFGGPSGNAAAGLLSIPLVP